MEKENLPNFPFTSTPMRGKSTGKVLKENQPPRKLTRNAKPANNAPKLGQNRRRSAPVTSAKNKNQLDDEKREAKRREQALESMVILEKRRLRLNEAQIHEDTVDGTANFSLSISPINDNKTSVVPAVNPAEEKKRLRLKDMKLARIMEALALQEAMKNAQKPTSVPQAAEPKSKSRPRRRAAVNAPPPPPAVLKVKHEAPEVQNPQKFKRHIKYSLDELRSYNPYGFYFMWTLAGFAHSFLFSMLFSHFPPCWAVLRHSQCSLIIPQSLALGRNSWIKINTQKN